MKILINTPFFGGAGGMERLLRELCRTLDVDQIDIVYTWNLGGELSQLGPNVTARSRRSLRYRGSESSNPVLRMLCRVLIDPFRRRVLSNYDLEIQLNLIGHTLHSTRARTRLLNPCGAPVDIPGDFDLIWLESSDAVHSPSFNVPTKVFAPPSIGILEDAEPVEGIPEQFLLTVFNPHGPEKGTTDLEGLIDSIPLPLVWCHSNATIGDSVPEALLDHPNIIHIDDGTHSQFRWLYENAQAYLSFSRSESFGYAIADALVHCRAVVSRQVGVLSYPESIDDTVFLVGETWDFDWSLLHEIPEERTPRDLQHLSPERFRAHLLEI